RRGPAPPTEHLVHEPERIPHGPGDARGLPGLLLLNRSVLHGFSPAISPVDGRSLENDVHRGRRDVSAKARFFTYPPIAGDLTIRDVTREVESRGVDRFLMGETQPPGPPK